MSEKRLPILLLDPESSSQSGLNHIISNIDSVSVLRDILAPTFGPFGRDKLLISEESFSISNDGSYILNQLNIVHPIPKIIREISQLQDNTVGDGTTSICLLTASLLDKLKKIAQKKGSFNQIVKRLQWIEKIAIEQSHKLSFNCENIQNIFSPEILSGIINTKDKSKKYNLLQIAKQCARTSLSSKVLNKHSNIFSEMVISALYSNFTEIKYNDFHCNNINYYNNEKNNLNLIKYILAPGASINDSFLYNGIIFQSLFSYAGYERAPKYLNNKFISLINIELEITADKDNMEMRINNIEEYDNVVKAEFKLFFDKMQYLINAANNGNENKFLGVILSSLPIGDFATQFLSEKGIFCAGRVNKKTLEEISSITGAKIISNINDDLESLKNKFGCFSEFKESKIGGSNFIHISPPNQETFDSLSINNNKIEIKNNFSTFVLRGGSKNFLEECQRSLNDSVKIASVFLMSSGYAVAGAGSFEVDLAYRLRCISRDEKDILNISVINALAAAFESLPEQLSNNSGLNGLEIISELRKAAQNNNNFGIDLINRKCADKIMALEPIESKVSMIRNCIEACSLIINISETIKDKKSQ